MFVSGCCTDSMPREAAWPLVWAALVVAAATIGRPLLDAAGFGPVSGALLVGGAGLVGGAILNRHARVPGLPSAVAGVMALALYLASLLGPDAGSAGGTMFVALLLSVMVRSVRIGLVATAILAAALVLAALT
jgi:hypothetical protein